MGNREKVAALLVASEEWEEAFRWAERNPEMKQIVYLPYATALAEQDQFLLAQKGG